LAKNNGVFIDRNTIKKQIDSIGREKWQEFESSELQEKGN
jgi:hypothetical protein